MTTTASNANAFASTFYFFQPHKTTQKNKKSLQANAPETAKVQCKLDQTTLRTNRRAADNSTYKKLAVQWLNEHLCFVSSVLLADSFVLRNRQLLIAAKRYAALYDDKTL